MIFTVDCLLLNRSMQAGRMADLFADRIQFSRGIILVSEEASSVESVSAKTLLQQYRDLFQYHEGPLLGIR